MIECVVEHLARHDVDEVVLALSCLPEHFTRCYPEARIGDVRVRYSIEALPLDTAGAPALAVSTTGIADTFIAMNGDILTDLDVTALLAEHRDQGVDATIAVREVTDPSRCEVVVLDMERRVQAFVEKPDVRAEFSRLINAGVYVLEPEALSGESVGERRSLERELFPALARHGAVTALRSDAYWFDTGAPSTFLQANFDVLTRTGGHALLAGCHDFWLAPSSQVDPSARREFDRGRQRLRRGPGRRNRQRHLAPRRRRGRDHVAPRVGWTRCRRAPGSAGGAIVTGEATTEREKGTMPTHEYSVRPPRGSWRVWSVVGFTALVVASALVLELHGRHMTPSSTTLTSAPLSAVAGPKAELDATAPSAQGDSWVLTSTATGSNLQSINVNTGKVTEIIPTPLHSRAVAQSEGGALGLGEGTDTSGAVEFLRAPAATPTGVVAVSGPVISLAAGVDGVTFYALEQVHANRAVAVINSLTHKVSATLPMPSDAVSIAVDPGQSQIYALGSGGLTSIVSIATGKVTSQFPTGAAGRFLAISPDGSTLYVLDGSPILDNVAVVDVATEAIVRYLPAPQYTTAIAPSIDDSTLADFVGTPSMGNVQLFRTGR
jgi:dTDP-glucose pyrophosphorylase